MAISAAGVLVGEAEFVGDCVAGYGVAERELAGCEAAGEEFAGEGPDSGGAEGGVRWWVDGGGGREVGEGVFVVVG